MKNPISLRSIRKEDFLVISDSFAAQGWEKPNSQYEQYYHFQETGERDVIIAEYKTEFAGYLTIKWESDYPPFLDKQIPEIVDLNVLRKCQRLGIAKQLLDEAEGRIKDRSDFAGIGFGLCEDYGAAQILYIKRAYIPDGNGICKDYKTIPFGQSFILDHSIALFLKKRLM